MDRTLLPDHNWSSGTGCGFGKPPRAAARCADSSPMDWGDSRCASFPRSGLEHSAIVSGLGSTDDLYLAVSTRRIQFSEWAFFSLRDRNDGRSWDRVPLWNCNLHPPKVSTFLAE